METRMREHRTNNEAIYWNAAYHTTGMGVIKKRNVKAQTGSGFGVIKKRIGAVQSSYPPLAMVVDNSHLVGDTRLQKNADRILVWMKIFPKDAVKVDIKDGWMTLTGKVDWPHQRDVAVAAISNMFGVNGCTDKITVLFPE